MTESTTSSDSILDSVKKALGLGAGYDVFDPDIIMHINTAFATLTQLGIGPVEGFTIEDDSAEWDTFLHGDKRLSSVKTYIVMKVRLVFDPPGTSFVIGSMEKQIAEIEWRLNAQREGELWAQQQAAQQAVQSSTPMLD